MSGVILEPIPSQYSTYRHYRCPTCGRLCTVPWDQTWCTHHGSTFSPEGAADSETDWTEMERVDGLTAPQHAYEDRLERETGGTRR